eukprot:jgi/Bigna1/141718/aug1.64_g16426
MLKQSQSGLADLDMGSRVMDSNKLEQERGITILSKCASILLDSKETEVSSSSSSSSSSSVRVNLIDTPGHADFGGEVERIMNMVDGVCLVVDATEGPMSQTKFVLMKALAQGLRPIVVINKCDRETARLGEVENEVFDMFDAVGANDEQLDFPIVYASAKMGWATLEEPEGSVETDDCDMRPLFDTILNHVPPPMVDDVTPFSMLVTQTQANSFLGKELIGRIQTGSVSVGDLCHFISPDGNSISEDAKVTKISQWQGIVQTDIERASSGDVVAIAGFPRAGTIYGYLVLQSVDVKRRGVNDTLATTSVKEAVQCVPIDPPVLSIIVTSNSASPLSGMDGDKCTFPIIMERLEAEIETNVSLTLTKIGSEQVQLHGRGELQLGILLEQMRREGFELACSSPQAVLKQDENNPESMLEPVEELVIDCHNDHAGQVIEKMAKRKADLVSYDQTDARSKLVFKIPFRALLGYRAEFTQDTRGDGIIHSMFDGYIPYKGAIDRNEKGALISLESGKATAHALGPLEVYPGMVIGESARGSDLDVNACKEKELTNVRAAGKDDKVKLAPPVRMSIEQCITYVRDDELIEITPKRVSIRKMHDAKEHIQRSLCIQPTMFTTTGGVNKTLTDVPFSALSRQRKRRARDAKNAKNR